MKQPRIGWRVLPGVAAMAVATAVLGASPALADSLGFTNGNFEGGSYAGTAGFETLTAGTPSATAMTGWGVASGSVDWIQSYWQQPPGGGYSLDMNGTPSAAQPNPAGTISQTFAVDTDELYDVYFELAGNPVCGPSIKAVTVNAITNSALLSGGGNGTTSFGFDTSGKTTSNMGWTEEGPLVIAAGSATDSPMSQYTLTFTADPGNTSNCGAAIADVVVTPTNSFIANWG